MIATRKPDGTGDVAPEEAQTNHALEAAAEDLIRAVHAKDVKGVVAALEAAYAECDKEDEPDAAAEG